MARGPSSSTVNPASQGFLTVAIVTTDTFDATTVDPLSVELGRDGATETHGRRHEQDVDLDGDVDLVLHFRIRETGIRCGDTSVALVGQTLDGLYPPKNPRTAAQTASTSSSVSSGNIGRQSTRAAAAVATGSSPVSIPSSSNAGWRWRGEG